MPRDLIYALCIRYQLVGPLQVGLGIACDHSTTVKTQHGSTIVFKRLVHTTDHRVWKTGLPVRSAVLKPVLCNVPKRS